MGRYKTQVNERLIQECSQLDHTISVLRQQLENAEGERKECVEKLKSQVRANPVTSFTLIPNPNPSLHHSPNLNPNPNALAMNLILVVILSLTPTLTPTFDLWSL